MLQLSDDERIILVLRRHWWTLVGPSLLAIALFILPPLLITLLPRIVTNLNWAALGGFSEIFFYGWMLSLLLFVFIVWTDYYLDVWIITSKRIIDIEQRALFNRKISEFSMDRVQDVSIQINGIVETMLKFGSIRVDTAGHDLFLIDNVPDLYRAKDAILHYSSAGRQKE